MQAVLAHEFAGVGIASQAARTTCGKCWGLMHGFGFLQSGQRGRQRQAL